MGNADMSDNKKFLWGVGIVAFLFVFSKVVLAKTKEEEEEATEEEQKAASGVYPEGCKANSVLEIESLHDLLLETFVKSKGLSLKEVELNPSLISALDKAKKEVSASPLLSIYKGLLPAETIDRLCWLVVRFGMGKDRLISIDFSQLEEGTIFFGSKALKGFKDKETIEEAKKTIEETLKTFFKGEVRSVYLLKPEVEAGSIAERRYTEFSNYIFEVFKSFDDKNLTIFLDVEYPE